jgi:hypothetical protein
VLIVSVAFAAACLCALERMEFPVLDIVYVVAIIAVAAVVLLVAKGVEKL